MPKKRQNRDVKLPVLRPDAAGADIGAEEIFVAVPADRDSEPVRRFATFTADLSVGRLADEMRDPHRGDGVDWSVLDLASPDS